MECCRCTSARCTRSVGAAGEGEGVKGAATECGYVAVVAAAACLALLPLSHSLRMLTV